MYVPDGCDNHTSTDTSIALTSMTLCVITSVAMSSSLSIVLSIVGVFVVIRVRYSKGVSLVIQHRVTNDCHEVMWLVSSLTMLDTTIVSFVLVTACAVAMVVGLRSLK
jgi:hypothetical protein